MAADTLGADGDQPVTADPEVQELMRRLAPYGLGVCLPHMHVTEQELAPLPQGTVQFEADSKSHSSMSTTLKCRRRCRSPGSGTMECGWSAAVGKVIQPPPTEQAPFRARCAAAGPHSTEETEATPHAGIKRADCATGCDSPAPRDSTEAMMEAVAMNHDP